MQCRAIMCLLASFVAGVRPMLLQDGMSARDYYQELYKAGGLDNFADEYACFHDRQDLQTFFIIGRSDAMMQLFKESGEWEKMSRKQHADLERGFLMRVGYNKGLPNGMEYMDADPSHTSYSEDIELPGQNGAKGTPVRITLQINWDTLRYKNAVSRRGNPVPSAEDAGRCETIPLSVRQHGHR